jgi:hypothetical protein
MIYAIIAAAIIVVALCLHCSTPSYGGTETPSESLIQNDRQNRWGSDDLLAFPGDIISGGENLTECDDLLLGGTTYDMYHDD